MHLYAVWVKVPTCESLYSRCVHTRINYNFDKHFKCFIEPSVGSVYYVPARVRMITEHKTAELMEDGIIKKKSAAGASFMHRV